MMSSIAVDVRRFYNQLLQLVHPLLDAFIPVNYTPERAWKEKKRLDPNRTRNQNSANEATNTRILNITSALGMDQNRARLLIEEARHVELLPDHPNGEIQLASPMSYEDRYTVYVITRAIAPSVVVETGVAHGVSSAYILSALRTANKGKLISIELTDQLEIGHLIPHELKTRWSLITGNSLEKLPEVCRKNDSIDVFIHDSFHSYKNMRTEYDTVWPHLSPGGILCSHDILMNNCFTRFVRKHRNEIDVCIQSINFGLIRKRKQ